MVETIGSPVHMSSSTVIVLIRIDRYKSVNKLEVRLLGQVQQALERPGVYGESRDRK